MRHLLYVPVLRGGKTAALARRRGRGGKSGSTLASKDAAAAGDNSNNQL